MELADAIELRDVLVDLKAASKADLLRGLSDIACERTGIPANDILSVLNGRERLGSTGIGNGIAIPHANLGGLGRPFTLLARLKQPIDFEAIDDHPVDIVFLALSPASKGAAHLGLLAAIARNARSPRWLGEVRKARSPEALHNLLTGEAG